MTVEMEITPIKSFEITPETLEFTTGADTRNIGIKHFLCLRQTLPKTRLSQAILYENVSYSRQLAMKMESMRKDRLKYAQVLESNMRAFRQSQQRKQQKWKRVDEIRLSNMNLPCVHLKNEGERPKSCKIMYRMSEFKPDHGKPDSRSPVLPNMKLHMTVVREQTEIITHREKTFMTKFPEIIEYEPQVINKYNSYCGKLLLEEGSSGRDGRFNRFINCLSPAKVDENDYPIENLRSMSRLFKYATKDDRQGRQTPRSAKQVPKSHQQNMKHEVARRFEAIKSRENTFYSDDSDPSNDRLQKTEAAIKHAERFQRKGEYLLETYRSDDVIHINKHRKQEHDDIPEEESSPQTVSVSEPNTARD
ncbi:uncharacterized protein LOC127868699 [Dreissena polymorpha]|uniref:Uncharacterized protein n=1 Tax=Dreissena polymorpha TaxID=45954 RepID=A0A9D4M780_DREPO|nr:uncharacterized protein LOC127868699 [Dreissena polymorpha]KAH3872182.1 hypothetical protein DPMN_035397 [Dreissena polymorpha]